MNVFQLEDFRLQLITNLQKDQTPFGKLQLFHEYFDKIISTENHLIYESFLTEFLNEYFTCLDNFSPYGIEPYISNEIITKCEELIRNISFAEINEKIKTTLAKIKDELTNLEKSLEGEDVKLEEHNLSFPIMMNSVYFVKTIGQIEYFSVKINKDKTLTKNKFLVIPSIKNIEERLSEQIEISWNLAKKYLKKFFPKPHKFHEVIIVFNHKYAQYEGYSLGLSLTLSFIQELFKFYNTPLSLKVKNNVTFSGGLNEDGIVKEIGNNIIKTKVQTVFFSTNNYFAIPESDFTTAKNEIEKLKEIYPNRKIKLLSISEFEDLINQRQILSIEKANIYKRTLKFVKGKEVILLLTFLNLMFLSMYIIYSYDDNPVEFENINHKVNILNEHGRILWTTKQSRNISVFGSDYKHAQRLYDIDGDGTNEVILSNEIMDINESNNKGRIACFNNHGKLIWQYKFLDSISTSKEKFNPKEFACQLVDIVKEKNKVILLANARHLYFPSAIFKLDIRTGKRLQGTLWSQGHFHSGIAGDFNKDGKNEIFIGGVNNGMESGFVLFVDYDNLYGQTPSKENYLFKGIPLANLKKYYLFSKTDVCKYLGLRFNSAVNVTFDLNEHDFVVNVFEGKIKQPMGIVYRISKNLNNITTQLGDDMMFMRDSLVRSGKLNPPLTYDPKYSEILLNGIKEWNGKEFVKYINNANYSKLKN